MKHKRLFVHLLFQVRMSRRNGPKICILHLSATGELYLEASEVCWDYIADLKRIASYSLSYEKIQFFSSGVPGSIFFCCSALFAITGSLMYAYSDHHRIELYVNLCIVLHLRLNALGSFRSPEGHDLSLIKVCIAVIEH